MAARWGMLPHRTCAPAAGRTCSNPTVGMGRKLAGWSLPSLSFRYTKGASISRAPISKEALGLGRVDQKIVERLGTLFLVPIGDFLALDTISRPRHSMQALDADVFFAVQTHAKSTFVNAVQRAANVAKQVRFPVEITDRQFPLRRVLDFVQGVRALLDCDPIPIPQHLHQLSLFGFQDFFEFV